MSLSFRLVTVRGIPVRVHASFVLVLLWAAYIGFASSGGSNWLRGAAFMVVFALLLFLCVILHELGHSLVAQLFGVRVLDITLWPIGGVARIVNLPRQPYQEFLISAAGPAVNIFLGILLGIVAVAWIGPDQLVASLFSPYQFQRLLSGMGVQTLLLLLAANNLFLAIFNLVPAFPMDGGRLLRSVLAAFLPFGRATQVASWLGQAAALLMGMAALLTGNPWLGLVAIFVFASAWGERQQVIAAASLTGVTVRQAMQPIGARLDPHDSVRQVAERVAALPQAVYAVIDEGRLVGILSRHDLLQALRSGGAASQVGQHLSREYVRFSPDETLTGAQERLSAAQPPFGVVVEGGRVVGLLSRGDIARTAEALEACRRTRPRRNAPPSE